MTGSTVSRQDGGAVKMGIEEMFQGRSIRCEGLKIMGFLC